MPLLLLLADVVRSAAGGAPQNAYLNAVEAYRAGRFGEAVEMSRLIPADRLRAESALVLVGPYATPPLMKAAYALRTEIQFSLGITTCAWSVRDSRGLKLRDALEARVRSLPDGAALIRAKALMLIAFHQGQGTLRHALDCYRDPPVDLGSDAEAQLALCAIHEIGWRRAHEDENGEPGFGGSLPDAERACRAAAASAPELDEARLHLAGAIALQGRAREALDILAAKPPRERGFLYLWRLLEARLLQQLERPDDATARFASARELFPQAQSVRIAEASLAYAQGRRADASRAIEEVTSTVPENDAADPWLWYTKGTAWRGSNYLGEMRRLAVGGNPGQQISLR